MSAVAEKIDWDAWRSAYDMLTFADQQELYELVSWLHPKQESFDKVAAHRAFDAIGGVDLEVVELGGWNGQLADNMLARGDVKLWMNYDIADVPQACDDPRYRLEVLTDYFWNGPPVTGDVFIACHTIEHLKARELKQLFALLETRWVYLEAPLHDGPRDWTGYEGSHILEIGWNGVLDLLEEFGYVLNRTDLPLWWRK